MLRHQTTWLVLLVLVCATAAMAATAEDQPFTPRQGQQVGEVIYKGFELPDASPFENQSENEFFWSARIEHPGASYVCPHFSQFMLPEGAHAVIRSEDSSRMWTYEHYGKGDMGVTGGFWGIHIPGSVAIIDVYSPLPLVTGAVTIDRYARGYTAVEMHTLYGEALCGSDDSEWAKCYQTSEPAIYNKGKAVARLLINGSSACTGWLIGDEGHVMTNEHCIGTASDAANTDFEFMAEGATCTTSCSSWGACPGNVVATTSSLVQLDANLDYSLVKLPTNPTSTYGYLQLRSTTPSVNERIYIPQHPQAWGKKIAVYSSDSTDASGYCEVYSTNETPCAGGPGDIGYFADTQGGSSGSPVLAYSDNLVVSLHHCANCPNRGVPIPAIISDLGSNLPDNAIGGGGGNIPPTASFTYTVTGLAVSFTDTSSDPDGSVVAWSWSFGDGGTSTTRNPSHTYAADGSYTVTLTVTDNDSDTGSTSQTITVGGGGIVTLQNGVPVANLSGAQGTWKHFKIDVPTGATNLVMQIAGGSGDADLYTRFGSQPTSTSYDCRPYKSGNTESCTVASPQVGTYYLSLYGYSAYSGVTITASYSTSGGGCTLQNGVPVTGLSAAQGDWVYCSIVVPSGVSTLTVQISGGSGDADLYTRYGAQPTTTSYACRPYLYGNNETCTHSSPTAGTWYVGIRAYSAFSSVTLVASY